MNTWALQPPPWWPWLVVLVPIALLLCVVCGRRYHRQVRAELGPRQFALLGARRFVVARATCLGLAVAAISIALLRPVVPGREAQLAPDVVLCVDVSRSMLAGDGDPTRFASLRRQAHGLLQGGIGSRFALLAFTSDVQTIAPLTADRDAVAWLLDELLPGAVLTVGGTNVGAAIEVGCALLEGGATAGDVVLLTDGEDFEGMGERAAMAAAASGHRVHCVGFGSQAGSKIVIDRAGEQAYLQDASGDDVITRLDVASLRNVVSAGDGTFVRDADGDELLRLWRDDLLPYAAENRLAAGEADVVPRFGWPLLAGLLLLMLHLCLPERR